MTNVQYTLSRPARRRRLRALAFVLGGLALVVGGIAVALLVRTLQYRGETMPGVRVFGQEVGGQSRSRLERSIESIVGARLARSIQVDVGGRSVSLVPSRVLGVNAPATAGVALHAGQSSFVQRAETLLLPFGRAHEIVPVLRIRRGAAGAFLAELAEYGRQPADANVAMQGVTPVVTAARAGTAPLGNRLLADLERAVLAGSGSVTLNFRPAAPKIPTLAAKVAASQASAMLGAPVTLSANGNQVGSLTPDTLAGLLRFIPRRTGYSVTLDRGALATVVEPFVKPLETEPKDATFAVSGDAVSVVPSQPGFKFDPRGTLGAVLAAARQSSARDAALTLAPTQPKLTTKRAQGLGVTTKLVDYTTQMGTSSTNRIHNVHLMADFIDGTIIRPGQTFSFNKVVGPRTADRGFLEGQQIVGSLTLPAIGGGVCQTATTLFNDAFEAGLTITRRINHSYYLNHYPLGRDATVSYGGPDLVFTNNLKSGILIKSSYTDQTLTFTFYSTPQNRKVVSTTTPQTNWTDPKATNAYDPSGHVAAPGTTVTVKGSGERGFDVTVYRKVWEDGKLIKNDSYFSRYIPVGDTLVYGPGTKPPTPYIVLPSGP